MIKTDQCNMDCLKEMIFLVHFMFETLLNAGRICTSDKIWVRNGINGKHGVAQDSLTLISPNTVAYCCMVMHNIF